MNKKTFRLLVIDDTKALNTLIVQTLKKAGFNVNSVSTYQTAKKLLNEENFDLIILDWQLDHGRVGLELLPFMQGETRVILTSSMPSYQLSEMVYENEKINDYVPKAEVDHLLVPKINLLLKKLSEAEKKVSLNLTLTAKEFKFLKKCFVVLDESFKINAAIEESCMAILLGMKKQTQKTFGRFVHKMSAHLREVEKERGNTDESPYEV